MCGVRYQDRTGDSGITTRGFTTKLTAPYRNTLDLQPTCSDQPTFDLPRSCVQFRVFLYGHIETHSGRISQIPAHTLTMHSAVRLYRFQNVFLYGIRVRESNPFSTYDDLSPRTPFATG